MKKILIILILVILSVSCRKKEKHSEIVRKALEKIYGNKGNNIEDICADEYELFYSYMKGNNEYDKTIELKKVSSDLWEGITTSDINDKNYKEEKIYYKAGKYYDSVTNKERKDLREVRPYFQNDIFKYEEFEVIHDLDDFSDGSPDYSLYAKYNDKTSFNSYFNEADIKDRNEDIIVYANYNDGKDEYKKKIELWLERENEKMRESCHLREEY